MNCVWEKRGAEEVEGEMPLMMSTAVAVAAVSVENFEQQPDNVKTEEVVFLYP